MKFEIELEMADSLFVQFLRHEAETVWSALKYLQEKENLKSFELEDLGYNTRLLVAMYIVEEYFTEKPEIRDKFPLVPTVSMRND